MRKELEEVEELRDLKEKSAEVAAFFDLDGTLLPPPSLEKRFFRRLRERRLIDAANYFHWAAEAVRLFPRGLNQILYANKMYLRAVRLDEALCAMQNVTRTGDLRGVAPSASPEDPPTEFFSRAVERVAWHAQRGHAVVVLSGTLQPLAKEAVAELRHQLKRRGIPARIEVIATRLETHNGAWTGRITGEAMFGEAKARAMRRFAAAREIALEKCFAYGNSTNDRWMLELVGKPTAVNPSNDLARIAARNGWPVLRWSEMGSSTQGSQREQRRKTGSEEDNSDEEKGFEEHSDAVQMKTGLGT
jgi:HAD superfamily hydrolase (TIGR01490 family)